ncbi:MAG TPA: pentapeptide repeat-containing protein, partial [Allocoleopsis sp.]
MLPQNLVEIKLLIQRLIYSPSGYFAHIDQNTELDLSKDLIGTDLSGINLSGMNLSEANLSYTNLSGANL